jgi:hypothetical protein
MKKSLLILLACLLVGIVSFGILVWTTADDIGRAAMSTSTLLMAKPVLNDETIIKWLEDYHGEAPGHQVMLTFAHWGMEHPQDFVLFLGRLSSSPLERLGWAIYDGGMSTEFLAVFGRSAGKNVSIVASKVKAFSTKIQSSPLRQKPEDR